MDPGHDRETKSFQQVRKNNDVVRLPFADVFRQQSREVFLVAGALTILFASFYLGVSYLTASGRACWASAARRC